MVLKKVPTKVNKAYIIVRWDQVLYKCRQGQVDFPKEDLNDWHWESFFPICICSYTAMKEGKKE